MTTTTAEIPKEDYLDKVSKQKIGYNELDKFVPGEAGLQYFPVPIEEYNIWKREQDRKSMEEWEKKQKDKQAILELRTEEPRGNGHNEIPTEIIKQNIHCDLKVKSKKRVKKK